MALMLSSSAGIISLLDEKDTQLKLFALSKLNVIVDEFWAEISEYISKIEILQEDVNFKHRDLAALVVSKVYYNLGEYSEALNYALEAGKLFNVNDTSEYVTTMISECLDFYIKHRLNNFDNIATLETIDIRIVKLVDDMFQRCLDSGKFKQAIGIALEARRLDIIQKALIESDNVEELLNHTFLMALSYIQNLTFLKMVLRELVNIYMSQNVPHYINICQCLIYLNDTQSLSNILIKLLKSKNKKDILIAYQMAFDAYQCGTQDFLRKVRKALGLISENDKDIKTIKEKDEDSHENLESIITEDENAHNILHNHDPTLEIAHKENIRKDENYQNSDETMAIDVKVEEEKNYLTTKEPNSLVNKISQEHFSKLDCILNGDLPIQLELQFLIQNNKTDIQILKNSKDCVRNSICHNAVIIAHAFTNCGTTNDKFLRNNLEWLAKATNWAKFTATASLGVIHKGHINEAMNLMSTYLPKENNSGSPYSEGGSLYALGLINVNHGAGIIDYLIQQLTNSNSEIIKHGACLGLGLAAISSNRLNVYETLKSNLYQDDAIIGEAAGLAMGLVMLGSNSSSVIDDMISYAKETRHEKITRGLILGIGLVMFGTMEQSESLIKSLTHDKDAILRRSAVYIIAMAYCGTGNNAAIQKLLHIAVSDVNDDVRRSAVTCIGFLLFQTPEQCPNIVSLLSESYNPHVRYGAALALGIACAGTGSKEALNMIEPLIDDNTNYVRQGALIASAMILIQQNEITQPKSTIFREKYSKIIGDKHEEIMAKFGAILAQGIIDAGGRNTTITFKSGRNNHVDVLSIVGTLLFTQFWFWYPFAHFLSLSFRSTSLIGLNYNLKMPKIEFISHAKPYTYSYPPPLETPKNKEKARLATVVLSYAKTKPHHHLQNHNFNNNNQKPVIQISGNEKPRIKEDDKKLMDYDIINPSLPTFSTEQVNCNLLSNTFSVVLNPARIMSEQLKVVSLPENFRYEPIKPVTEGGVILLYDTKDYLSEDIVTLTNTSQSKAEEDEGEEPAPPEPFKYFD
ncbi:26S proteasome non-ATPase regulatory subunit 1-like isoform X2 [Gordionus sp. m RMFG-2023]|uniref:26S proteasome non-ATPase regulatory subunit 1-like isoform X2 n=1 Tax=Gordionus sp. m RMFG-2023 TaxID=3053472 RepID=UPI0031FC7322